MADSKLSALTELAAKPAATDELYIRDESEAASAESKRITASNLALLATTAGTALADNAILRADGTDSQQGSALTVSDPSSSIVTLATTVGNTLAIDATEPAAAAGASVAGKNVTITAQDAVASTDTDGAAAGGLVIITSGAAARRNSGNANGGNIRLAGGAGIGTGTAGQVEVTSTASGTVPGLTFVGDTNTGISNGAAGDVLSFITGGSSIAAINTAGLTASSNNAYDIASFRNISSLSGNITQSNPTGGATCVIGQIHESLTLSTSGTTTDTTANLLPANSLILGVTARVTTTITTATDWSLGDATIATRFASANAVMTAGSTSVGLNHLKGGVALDTTGPVQVAAAKLRVTTTLTPGAGVIRLTVFYMQFTAPAA